MSLWLSHFYFQPAGSDIDDRDYVSSLFSLVDIFQLAKWA